MPFTGPPAVDFYSQLSGLGDTLQANQRLQQQQQIAGARKEAYTSFTALDPSSPDYGKQALTIAQKLGSIGDTDGAKTFLTQAQSAAERAHTIQREGVTDKHWAQSFELQKRAAARADEDKPLIKEIANPDGTTSFVRISSKGPLGPVDTGLPAAPVSGNPFGPGKFNGDQGKAAGFTDRMLQSENILLTNDSDKQGASVTQRGLNSIPGVGNMLVSENYQKYDQAKRDFINAQLRRESGAAIAPSEFDSAEKQYFPRVGDSEEVIKQKRANRRAAVEAMGREGGQSYRPKLTFSEDGKLVPFGAPAQKPQAAAPPAALIRAQNAAGQTLIWNGKMWIPESNGPAR